jgi:Protein of unknown function (DUF5672)
MRAETESSKVKKQNTVVVVPIYRTSLELLEQFSVDFSKEKLSGRVFVFAAPEGLDVSYYRKRYPDSLFETFEPRFFASVEDYSRLMLSRDFYQRFLAYEFLLLLQPDAIVFRDELTYWTGQPYDYIGAPWPDGYEFFVNLDRFSGAYGRRVKVHVGNGGLSLRRISKCLRLMDEFPEAIKLFSKTGSNEDFFFSMLGALSNDFVLPNEITASRFSMELKPEYYFQVNGGHYPMGSHAWGTVNAPFWAPCVPVLATVLQSE